ncbi:MAG: YigZ family protein [Lachnospiraceae bacterium]|nr:YigZ family protein [Lachnospiraceae bacterium]
MIDHYRTVYTGGTGEIIEKKSRFIADIEPVSTEEEALAFIEKKRKQYWDARHHCFAYIVGDNHAVMRCSDDGEPAQTAGRPMLDVLLKQELTNVCAVVTRYFGGTLLGTGGLVRAYSGAVAEGLKHTVLIEKKRARIMELTCDYNSLGKLQYLFAQMELSLLSSEYTDTVLLRVLVPAELSALFLSRVTEAVSGRFLPKAGEEVYYALAGKEVLLFEN